MWPISNEYLTRTKFARETRSCSQLLLSYVKPFGLVSRDTISRWVKFVLQSSGINVNIFKPHSTRSASTFKVELSDAPIPPLLPYTCITLHVCSPLDPPCHLLPTMHMASALHTKFTQPGAMLSLVIPLWWWWQRWNPSQTSTSAKFRSTSIFFYIIKMQYWLVDLKRKTLHILSSCELVTVLSPTQR